VTRLQAERTCAGTGIRGRGPEDSERGLTMVLLLAATRFDEGQAVKLADRYNGRLLDLDPSDLKAASFIRNGCNCLCQAGQNVQADREHDCTGQAGSCSCTQSVTDLRPPQPEVSACTGLAACA
jgi:hypothetical protein